MRKYSSVLICLLVLFFVVIVNVLFKDVFFRADLTDENRYSISQNTKNLMRSIEKPIRIDIFLDGDLNPGFLRLRSALRETLEELKIYSKTEFSYNFINPSKAENADEREKNYLNLQNRGMSPTNVFERDKEGKLIQKTVFPWAEVIAENDTILVNLLKNLPGNSGADNLNHSIENLEYEISDALRILNSSQTQKIAFIEGHGEWTEDFVYDASLAFSRYFQVDRGVLGTEPGVLDEYKAIIIARPLEKFSEAEKFIIDQYLMRGGRIFWLLDGVRVSQEEMSKSGTSPVIAEDANLSDLLFRYGVRVNPVLLQDVQCVRMPMNVSASGTPQYEQLPWFYAPLLRTAPSHPITRNIMQVKANFCSSIDILENPTVSSQILLATSNSSHKIQTPFFLDLKDFPDENDENYFNQRFLPVAVAMEGEFSSAFQNRLAPKEIDGFIEKKEKSKKTRMVVVADADVICNDIVPSGNGYQVLPLGLDRYSGMQFGNRDFVLNSLLYLTDDENWLNLRNRTFKVRMLNKKNVLENYAAIRLRNLILPISSLFFFGILIFLIRHLRYARKRK